MSALSSSIRLIIIFLLFALFLSSIRYINRYVDGRRDKKAEKILEAIRRSDLFQIKSILDSEPELVNIKDSAGFSPLHWAVIDGRREVVLLLISKGADVNSQSYRGYTPLHNAARCGHKEIIELLLVRGASSAIRSKDGFTPLGIAISYKRTEAADFLRNCGAKL